VREKYCWLAKNKRLKAQTNRLDIDIKIIITLLMKIGYISLQAGPALWGGGRGSHPRPRMPMAPSTGMHTQPKHTWYAVR
jgi:hypothetical protein